MKNKFLPLLLVLFISLNWIGCKDDDDDSVPDDVHSNLTISFTPTAGGQPIAINDTFKNFKDDDFVLQNLKYFISNIFLINEKDELVYGLDVAFFDHYEESTVSATFDIPAGGYKGISFGIGLDPEQNAMDPNTLPPSNPLSNTLNWWGWTKYRFVQIDGKVDSAGKFLGLSFHTGLDPMYRTVEFEKAFFMNSGGGTSLSFSFDMNDVFTKTDTINYYDLSQRGWHGETVNTFIAEIISDNIAASIVLAE